MVDKDLILRKLADLDQYGRQLSEYRDKDSAHRRADPSTGDRGVCRQTGGKSLIPEEALLKLIGTSQGRGSEEDAWGLYYEEFLRLGLTTPESRQALVAPKFADFAPIDVTGKPASELIIEAREVR